MANTGYKIWLTRKERFSDGDLAETGSVEDNTAFLPDGVTSDPDYVAKVLDNTSCPVPTAPEAPTNLSSSLLQDTSFRLYWVAPASGDDPTGYDIYRNGSFYLDVGLVTYADLTGFTAGNSYTWTVKAYNAIGDSPASTGLSVTMRYTIELKDSSSTSTCQGTPTPTSTYYMDSSTVTIGSTVVYQGNGNIVVGGNNWWWNENGDQYEISTTGVILDDYLLCEV